MTKENDEDKYIHSAIVIEEITLLEDDYTKQRLFQSMNIITLGFFKTIKVFMIGVKFLKESTKNILTLDNSVFWKTLQVST